MSKFFTSRLNRFIPFGLMASAAALLAPAAANATPYIVTLKQQGPNVVATGRGNINMTGLTCISNDYPEISNIWPGIGQIGTGTTTFNTRADTCTGGITGPTHFGSGNPTWASNGNGDFVGLDAYGADNVALYIFPGYVSNTTFSSSATWSNANFASLGVTPGTYTWKWGAGISAGQSFTLEIAVPEPASLGMFGFGVLLIGAFVGLRRRVA